MNYYNPYYFSMAPSMMSYPGAGAASTGLFSKLTSGLRGIGWSGILNNTQRTLGIINQAIPLVKQASPMMRNARTMFQIMNEFKKEDAPTNTPDTPSSPVSTPSSTSSTTATSEPMTVSSNTNGPTFFI